MCSRISRMIFLNIFILIAVSSAMSPVFAAAGSQIAKPTKDQQALAVASRRGDEDTVRKMLANGVKPHPDALFDLVRRGKLKMLQVFIDSGLDVNAKYDLLGVPNFDMTLLGTAVDSGRPEVVELLLKAGADPDQPHVGLKPLALAVQKGFTGIQDLLAKEDKKALQDADAAGLTLLHHAVMDGKVEAVRSLLTQGAKADPRNRQGQTPLYWAALKGNNEIVHMLLTAGADPNSRDNGGNTPLMPGAMSGSAAVVRSLLAAGADPDARNVKGNSAVSYAKGVDAVVEPLKAASRVLNKNLSVAKIVGKGVYPPGTLLSGPCAHTGAIPADAGCGSSGVEVLTYSTIRQTGGKQWTVAPPLCKPVKISEEGEYTVTVQEVRTSWKADDCYELKSIRGSGKQMIYFKKNTELSDRSFTFRVAAGARASEPKENKSPTIRIVKPADNAQFGFNSGSPGKLSIDLEGKTSDCGEDIAWEVANVGYCEKKIEPPLGDSTKVRFRGLPKDNTDFGKKKITARACGKMDSVTVEVFYNPVAKNHPGEGSAVTPNWFYYWRQTKAGQGFDPSYEPKRESVPSGVPAQAQYDYDTDRVILTDQTFSKSCFARPAALGGKESSGIDCYAELVRHETWHQKERWMWWGKTNPLALGFLERHKLDFDGDLVPDSVEEALSSKGCSKWDPTSCSGRPKDSLFDVEIEAYWKGWEWPVGSDDAEDWSSCLGKQWNEGGTCP